MPQDNIKQQQTILFIDDELICHDVINLIVKNTTSYAVISAYNGKEAINLAKKFADEINLIFLDILLPDMTGYEIYKKIKEDENLAHIPMIFQSGMSSRYEETQHILQAKGIYVMNKPYKNQELISVINQFMLKRPVILER